MKSFLSLIDQCLGWFWKRIEAITRLSDFEASVYRICFGTFLLLFHLSSFSWVGEVPQSFFDPHVLTIAYLFDGFPPQFVFSTFDIVIVFLVLGLTLGVRARWCSIAIFLSHFFVSSFAFSLGKIDHHFLPWFILLPLGFSNWGTQLAILPDKPVKTHGTAISIIAVCICFGMWSAGVEKAIRWVDFDLATSGIMRWFLGDYFGIERNRLLAEMMFSFPPVVLEAMDYMGVVFEITGFFFLLVGRTSWRIWLLVAAFFHMANALLLNIAFHMHFVLYLPFFMQSIRPLEKWIDLSGRRAFRACKPIFVLALLLALAHLVGRLLGSPSSCLFISDPVTVQVLVLYVSVLVWPVFIAFGILRLTRGRVKEI